MEGLYLLKDKNYLLLLLGSFVSNLGNRVYNFAIAWYILSLTGSATQAGLYIAVGTTIHLLLSPVGGVFADRWKRIKILYITDIINGLVIISTGFIIMGDLSLSSKLIVLYTAQITISLTSCFFGPAAMSLIPEIVKEEDLDQANSLIASSSSLTSIFGIALGGTIYTLFGPAWIFIINGLSFLFSGISEIFIKPEYEISVNNTKNITVTHILNEMKEGYIYIKENKALSSLIKIGLLFNFFGIPIFVNVLPYIFNQILKTEPIYLAGLEILMSIGMLSASLYLAHKKIKNYWKILVYGIIFSVSLYGGFIFMTYLVQYGIATFIIFYVISSIIFFFEGASNAIINIPLQTILQKKTKKEYMGRVFSLLGTLINIATPIALLLAGIGIDQFNIYFVSIICIVGNIFSIILLITNKHLKTL